MEASSSQVGFPLTSVLVGCMTFLTASWFLAIRKTRRMPPGPFQWPVLGNLPQLAKCTPYTILDYLQQLADQYNGIFALKFGAFNAVLVSDVDLVREALVKQASCFNDRPISFSIDNFYAAYPGFHAFFSNGEKWKSIRRFSLVAMKDVGVGKSTQEDIILEEVDAMVAELEKVKGQPTDPRHLTSQAVTNIIGSLMFGKRYEYGSSFFKSIVNGMRDVATSGSFFQLRDLFSILQMLPPNNDLKRLRHGSRTLKAEIERQLKLHEETFDPNGIRDLLDICIKESRLEGNKFLDHPTIVQMAIELFSAGGETTGTTLCWAWLFMAQHPDIQEKCQREIQENVGQKRITVKDKKTLPYCEATLTEIQRITSIAPLGVARVANKNTTLGGYDIPKGTWFLPFVHKIHFDDRVFKAADKFRPERFLDDNGGFHLSANVIPFSVGPRMCAGETLAKMEIFLFFTSVLQKFHIKNPTSSDLDFSCKMGFTLAPKPQEIIMEVRS